MQSDAASTVPEGGLRFKVLGALEVLKDGRDHAPTAPKSVQLLALLVAQAGRTVPNPTIMRELWGYNPPRSAQQTMQTYVYKLRRLLTELAGPDGGAELLVTKQPGYRLDIDPAWVDVFEFQQLCREGREHAEAGNFAAAARVLRSALSLWSGPPLANVDCGYVLAAYAVDLQEQRRNAHNMCIHAEIEAGMNPALIGELRSLTTHNPLDEELHAQLIRVLDRSGRRIEALSAYRNFRRQLNEQLGLEPNPELQRLHHQLLSAGQS